METKELLRKVRLIELKTRGLTKQIFAGEYHSAFKGRGMTFSEVREYQVGDDVRTIDWNVTARFNMPYVKIFDEERELNVMMIIDVSGSQFYGTDDKTKRELMIELVAILSFSAISNNDKVGAIFVSDKIEKYIPPAKGRKHALVILRELIDLEPKSKGTDLNQGLKFFQKVIKKRSVAFVMSDFFDRHDFLEGMKLSGRKHDVVALQIFDKSEEKLPNFGKIEFYNAETEEKTWIDSSDKEIQALYQKQFEQFEHQLEKDFRSAGIDFAKISTEEDYVKPLIRLFHKR